jgi:hypothetical protein
VLYTPLLYPTVSIVVSHCIHCCIPLYPLLYPTVSIVVSHCIHCCTIVSPWCPRPGCICAAARINSGEMLIHRPEEALVRSGDRTAVRCSAVQCSEVQCSAVQCSAVQCSAVQCLMPASTPELFSNINTTPAISTINKLSTSLRYAELHPKQRPALTVKICNHDFSDIRFKF